MDVLQEYYDNEFNVNRELPPLRELHPEEKAAVYNSLGYSKYRLAKAAQNVVQQMKKTVMEFHRIGACINQLCEKCNPK